MQCFRRLILAMIFATLAIPASSAPPADTPPAKDVNVVNVPGVVVENVEPIAVEDTSRTRLLTTSTRLGVPSGQTSDDGIARLPECPEGEQFLVTNLYAAPDSSDLGVSATAGAWVVSLRNVFQLRTSGFVRVPLIVASTNHVHGSAEIPGGQGTGSLAEDLDLRVDLAAPAGGVGFLEFEVHVTGFCGVPFVS